MSLDKFAEEILGHVMDTAQKPIRQENCPECESPHWNTVSGTHRVCLDCGQDFYTDVDYSPQPDMVNHPPHYTAHPSGVECIQITEHMSFCLGNAVKYIWRADLKNGTEDLEKAKWYLEREIARRAK